jgi:predicted nucleic acid-binding protein
VNPPGVLLDTGPLVALLSKHDADHELAKTLFAECATPLRTCEAVVSEAAFLLKTVHRKAPAELMKLARNGVYEISISLRDHFFNVESLLVRYDNRPISLADACLIRGAEIFEEPRILTFDSDFRIYRWERNKKFDVLA